MNKLTSWSCCLAIAFVALLVDSRVAHSQGLNFGGIKIQTDNQSNDDNDDDNANQNQNNSNRRRNRNSQSGDQSNNQNAEQFQQFFPGGQQNSQNSNNNRNQNGQNGFNQNGENQNRRSSNQGQNWNGGQNGITIGTWNGNKWNGSRNIDSWTKQYGGNQQPFSSQWYNDHPKAWKYDNNKANIWVNASLPGVYSWLNWGAVPQQYQGNYGPGKYDSGQQFDTSSYGNWYPLGVFSLMSGPGDSGTRIVQLAVDRNGQLAGNYYDMITNSSYNVSGNVRRQSQRAEWSLNKNQFVRFRAPIYQLLQPYGTITVQLQGGEQQWQFVRLEN